jgi:hypothetical protein
MVHADFVKFQGCAIFMLVDIYCLFEAWVMSWSDTLVSTGRFDNFTEIFGVGKIVT